MKWSIFGLLFVMLTGCMKASDMLNEVNYQLADTGIINNQKIERSASRRIQADSLIYIVQSHFPPMEHQTVSDNVLAQETFNAFVSYFPLVRQSLQPLGLEQALLKAREERADYLLYMRFVAGDQRVLMSRATIQFMLYELASGRMVDNGSIQIRGGLLTSIDSAPEDFLRQPMQSYARALLGLREY